MLNIQDYSLFTVYRLSRTDTTATIDITGTSDTIEIVLFNNKITEIMTEDDLLLLYKKQYERYLEILHLRSFWVLYDEIIQLKLYIRFFFYFVKKFNSNIGVKNYKKL